MALLGSTWRPPPLPQLLRVQPLQPLAPALYTISEQLPVQVALGVLERLEKVKTAWRKERKALNGKKKKKKGKKGKKK